MLLTPTYTNGCQRLYRSSTSLRITYYIEKWILIQDMKQFAIVYNPQKMQSSSKKNITVHSKNQSQHSKGLKRSKSTEQLMPKKPAKKPSCDKPEVKQSLSKSKSTKSLKGKTKISTASECSSKKPRPKKSIKTVKKGREAREVQEMSSVLTDDWENKKPVSEYFIYHNNYIPIENSAQRRLVYKIQMIDLQNHSTTDSFLPQKQPPPQPRREEIAMGTDVVLFREMAVGETIETGCKEIQTEKVKFEQNAEKCFADVLTELQFLYLPNQDTFAPFSSNERVHYGELLQTLARKMLGEGRAVVAEASLTDEQVTVLLYQREGIQVGALEFVPLEGFPTHLLSILAYLKNLFCFLEYGFKEEVLASLRQFYGLNYNERVRRLSRGQPHERDDRTVLSPQIFQAFQNEMFKDYEFVNEATRQAVHCHNRAVFDAVNTELQFFRPFFSSEGEPFPWTNNLGMTHYDITEEALYIIFVQVKEKIQRNAVTLCGMFTDFDDEELPRPDRNALYRKRMEERQEKMIQEEVKALDDKVALDYETSSFYFQLASEVFYSLVDELEADLVRLTGGRRPEEGQFQYFN